MSWKTLIIKDSEYINVFLDSVVIRTKQGEVKQPIGDLNSVIFESYKTTITTRVINKLAEKGVLTILCDDTLMPNALITPIKGHHKQYEQILNQINWNKKDKLFLWTKIVKNKIENQIDNLKMTNKNFDKVAHLNKFISELQLGDSTNREAHAAKVYFHELFGMEFRRNKDNHINSALNFGYSIIRSAVARTICSKGLHPSISLFHHNGFNAFALADDLMEPFRPIVDLYVFSKIMNEDYFSRNHRIALINLLNCKVTINGKSVYLTNAIEIYIDEVINFFKEKKFSDEKFPDVSSVLYYEL
ncbi:type II CRISPR-associated endonuclease Cas1 [Spiroplasma alleghenense]|uniref:CRISPR-associated endonuclease Cas1 n=1 Tax=Spiroplasma alleghenense TaxID=216931 RepID=A0A345Z4S7_9MOLU|nr:type II CRISPR-associated endonuclease Cas1 [Spiroplasma alleghenense]AXK51606.1 CRISPR-associated protein Cas1 [Spiroplasma alleghenense]